MSWHIPTELGETHGRKPNKCQGRPPEDEREREVGLNLLLVALCCGHAGVDQAREEQAETRSYVQSTVRIHYLLVVACSKQKHGCKTKPTYLYIYIYIILIVACRPVGQQFATLAIIAQDDVNKYTKMGSCTMPRDNSSAEKSCLCTCICGGFTTSCHRQTQATEATKSNTVLYMQTFLDIPGGVCSR